MLLDISKRFYFLSFLFLCLSCGITKKVQDTESPKLPKVKEEVILQKLKEWSQNKPAFYYFKSGTKYKDNHQNFSFTISSRMNIDTAFLATITYAKIPVFSAYLTPDSATIIDRRNKCFIQESMDYLKEIFQLDFSYKNMEELFLGLPIAWNEDTEYHQIKDNYHYIVSPQKKREIRKMKMEDDEGILLYYLHPGLQNLQQIVIERPYDEISAVIEYKKWEFIERYNIPTEIDVTITTPRNNIFVNFRTTKKEVNKPEEMFISIPEKYERCE